VLKLLLLTLLFFSSLYANKVIYLSYEKTPQRVVKGEIFPITLKAISTVRDFEDIKYKFSNYTGLKILNDVPYREIKGKYYYETFYLLVTASRAKLPDIKASLIRSQSADLQSNQEPLPTTFLRGEKLNVITLNPKKEFSNVIANSFELQEFKTTSYDKKHNIVVFVATATNSDMHKIKFKNVYKQGIESINDSYLNPKVTYYVVISKKLEHFSFSYFNLLKNRYIKVSIPIVVDDDSVVAQSDLKPKDQSKEQLKITIAAGIAVLGFLFIVWRKKYIYLILILFPLAYIMYLAIPQKDVCVKANSDIHLLPVANGTIFETTSVEQTMQKEGSVAKFVKVKLHNDKIGWVKNEDTCSY